MNRASSFDGREDALHRLLRQAVRDRHVLPKGQPFAFSTITGKIRKDNQDTALIVTGRRTAASRTYLGAILCDGMGGLENGGPAADLAAAYVAAALVADHGASSPVDRMRQAITEANSALWNQFHGRAGTVLVAFLYEDKAGVIGWVGDARAYGLRPGHAPAQLTQDDTVASAVARIEGPAPDALDTLLRAVGLKPKVDPHVAMIPSGLSSILLLSDGVHRIQQAAFEWVTANAKTPADLTQRLVAAASWEGGIDNATALAVDLVDLPDFEETGQIVSVWIESQPRIWQTLPRQAEAIRHPTESDRPHPLNAKRRGHRDVDASPPAAEPQAEPEKGKTTRARPEQTPLSIELGDTPKGAS